MNEEFQLRLLVELYEERRRKIRMTVREWLRCVCFEADSGEAALRLFFFHAEDGIRDRNVTGVQTCALPISPATTHAKTSSSGRPTSWTQRGISILVGAGAPGMKTMVSRASSQTAISPSIKLTSGRSEERRVGTECR